MSIDWDQAVCTEEDPDLFFPIGNTGPALLQIEEAKAVCRLCPITEQCLQWALETDQEHGIWGGASEDDRLVMRALITAQLHRAAHHSKTAAAFATA